VQIEFPTRNLLDTTPHKRITNTFTIKSLAGSRRAGLFHFGPSSRMRPARQRGSGKDSSTWPRNTVSDPRRRIVHLLSAVSAG